MPQKKLAVICPKGLDSFLGWSKKITGYDVRTFIVDSTEGIDAALEWGDVIWLEWCNEAAVYATSKLGNIKGRKKVIVRLHKYEAFADYPNIMHWSQVNGLVFVAEHMRKRTFARFPELSQFPWLKTAVVHNGVDLEEMLLIPKADRDPRHIAWVGRMCLLKNFPLALQIMAALPRDEGYHLHVAGGYQDEMLKEYVGHIITEMSLKDRVTLYGHLSGDAMNDFWPGKGVILSTSLHEGHPVGIMEGMARGLTPIVHYFPDADEFYRPDNLFRTVYEGGLKIQGFIRSNNPRREIIERGFTLNEQARKIESFIDEVTA